ncbi:hypothetical protein ACFB49_44540 [Sphingomonas sp. DBB INV C78]|uniref:hypothetical protein n=1 Tax=Sphingomonas sp. DBB INV C78 TaxID=3349434 RepID=UPI0036D2CA29
MEPFTAWVDFQEEMLKLQRAQLDATKQMIDAGADAVATQKAAAQATDAGIKAWKSWFHLWGIK